MYKVTILDSSKKNIRTYEHINKIAYTTIMDTTVVEGDDILTHSFSLEFPLHLYSDTGNYLISSSIIGALEIEKEL